MASLTLVIEDALLQGKTEQPLLTAMREQIEALVAELRALG